LNTPAHLVLNALVLGRGNWRDAWFPITAGALMPDLPMFAFYAYQRFLGAPEALIWSDSYFHPDWQLLFDLFNSLPLLAFAALVSWRAHWRGPLAFFSSMILHCLTDLPLHHEDAHAHFLPFSNWRFHSPISYWDPRHHGRIAAVVEMLFVLVGAGSLALRSPVRAWRVVGAFALASYAGFIAYAVITWLPDV
jgi:hypothetical protein